MTNSWQRITRRLARMLAVGRVETLRLMRDRTSLSLIVVVPAIQIVLFGYAVNLDPKNVPLAIARDHGDPGDPLRRAIEETGYFSIIADGLEPDAAARMVAGASALVGNRAPGCRLFRPASAIEEGENCC
jgi:ABC-2 type transport system permease protein